MMFDAGFFVLVLAITWGVLFAKAIGFVGEALMTWVMANEVSTDGRTEVAQSAILAVVLFVLGSGGAIVWALFFRS